MGRAVFLATLGLALVLLPASSAYVQFLVATILIYTLVAMSLTILTGFGGQVSIGHAAFWALGAYTTAILTPMSVPFIVTVVAGGVVAAALGIVVALPALRVQGHYLAIATLGFALFVQQVLYEWESLTGGRHGLFVERPNLFGFELTTDLAYCYFLIPTVLLFSWITDNLKRSHSGLALFALKMSSTAATSAGIDRARHLVLAFTVSAFFTGVSGALYAHLIGYLSTESFSLVTSLAFLTMAVIGGLGSSIGALLGAAYLTLAPEVMRELGSAQMVVYGLTLVLFLRFLPGGLASLPEALTRAWRRRPR
ncbi:MAG TPA: branched-chain amino acid ABC transporter permease [Burkholderiaceae bacterium]|nr:branched-chain amino acid ABC transporter permease [Burkholderiaceae bacterium]